MGTMNEADIENQETAAKNEETAAEDEENAPKSESQEGAQDLKWYQGRKIIRSGGEPRGQSWVAVLLLGIVPFAGPAASLGVPIAAVGNDCVDNNTLKDICIYLIVSAIVGIPFTVIFKTLPFVHRFKLRNSDAPYEYPASHILLAKVCAVLTFGLTIWGAVLVFSHFEYFSPAKGNAYEKCQNSVYIMGFISVIVTFFFLSLGALYLLYQKMKKTKDSKATATED